MSSFEYEAHHDDRNFFQRHMAKIGLFLLLGVGGGVMAKQMSGRHSASTRMPDMTFVSVKLPPPPPPPPPPPQQTPPPEQKVETKMVEQTPVENEPPKQAEAPKDEPAPIGTNITGNGPADGFGLGKGGGIGGLGNGTGNGNGSRSKWGWYAGKVQNAIADALRRNSRTRSAALTVQVRVWADANGRITRAQLAGSTGDAGMDSTLSNEVLNGLQLPEAPPQDMPMPINLRITARKPN